MRYMTVKEIDKLLEQIDSKEDIDNLLKNSFTLTDEEKEKYSKEILTDEEIKKLKAMMTDPEDNSIDVESDFV